MLLMDADDDMTMPVNMGNPVEFTIKELAELIIELTGSSSKLQYLAAPQDDPFQRRPDISRAERFLGWRPIVQLRQGLESTIGYFEDLLGQKRGAILANKREEVLG